MKIPAFLTCLLAIVLGATPLRKARAEDASFDLFYNSLSDDGDWYRTPEFGYVWQPSVAGRLGQWRPYTDGYWAQTDDGWTWITNENFGWATYHYGRWTRLQDTGWVWVPGYDWGSAWVSWRTSEEYVGWAPLPPKSQQNVAEVRPGGRRGRAPAAIESVDYTDVEAEEGYTPAVDERFDIGPDNYCFVPVRRFGDAVLREVIVPPQQNIVIIQTTVNVTNISYRRGPERLMIFNGGPDLAFIDGHVERPIRRLRLEHHDDLNFLRDRTRQGGNPELVSEGVLQVASPTIVGRVVDFTHTRPPQLKQDLAQPKLVRGWENTGADAATVQRVREQLKEQGRNPGVRPAGGSPGGHAALAGAPGSLHDPAAAEGSRERESGIVPPASKIPPEPAGISSAAPRELSAEEELEARRARVQRRQIVVPPGGEFEPPNPAPDSHRAQPQPPPDKIDKRDDKKKQPESR